MKTRIVKPAVCESRLVCEPIAPCELLPNGIPGTLTINGTEYAVSILGECHPAGEIIVDGIRMVKEDGTAHDLCIVAGAYECTCGDFTFTRASRDPKGCKHVQAARKHWGDLLANPTHKRPLSLAERAASWQMAELEDL